MRAKKSIWSSVLFAAWLVWMADAASKAWALTTLEGKAPRHILGEFLQFTFTKNSGAAFSFATGGTFFLTSFALVVVVAIAYWSRKITSPAWAIVLGLVLGGSLGNLSDRIFRTGSNRGFFSGEVIDWISLPHWPIFNLADSAIVIAAVLATILSFRNIAPISPAGPIDPHDSESEGSNGA
ncbi:unannotated protein [freshwater metagenome]|uniref:Unannotated protein n=1 Tax=freshwater metagenome TaxID=449393 RepID=A0A6J6QKU4_9ZZZZ